LGILIGGTRREAKALEMQRQKDQMRIGFIGLGIMGSRMAANLQKHGYAMVVFNRTCSKAEPLRKQGATVAESPARVAAQADMLFTMLSQPEAVEQMALCSDGFLNHLRANTTWIDCSTVNPSFSKKMAAEAARRKVRFLDAPVTGSAPVAADGKLVFWIGGEASDLQVVRALLLCLGTKIVHVGTNGSGSAMKLVINLLLGVSMAAFAEAIALGEGLGLQSRVIFDALNGMPQVAPFLLSKRQNIEDGNYPAQFPLAWVQKDLHLASVSAYESGVALPLTNSAKEIYRLAMRNGHANEDFSAVCDYLTRNGSSGSTRFRHEGHGFAGVDAIAQSHSIPDR
jgi:3-hydroxyisobutyrate dehydrogenase-like beta-hydroxyacid dehydrogenase